MMNKLRLRIDKRRSDLRNLAKVRPSRAFTLIETLVAVLILATAVTGPLTIASKGLQSALVAKDQIIADYLAQDAVEYIRFARDTNGLKGDDWLSGSPTGDQSTNLSPCEGASGCEIDTLNQSASVKIPTACPSSGCPALNYNGGTPDDPGTAQYTYDTGTGITATPFTRTIQISLIGTDEASTTVTVTWSDLPGVTHKVVVQEHLFNWEKASTP